MNSLRDPDQVMAEINITPFTDVLLVLLIIFMLLAALITPPGFQKSLPNADCACVKHRPTITKNIELLITRSGKIFLGQSLVDKDALYGSLSRAAASEKHPRLRITADTKAHYGLVIRALDAAKLAKVDDVTLVTE